MVTSSGFDSDMSLKRSVINVMCAYVLLFYCSYCRSVHPISNLIFQSPIHAAK